MKGSGRNTVTSASGMYPAMLIILAALVILIVVPLFQKGTFIDGQLYKTVAFNSAMDAATFWSMRYTNTCMTFFCEQPPLYPFLLGAFYHCFGSHYLVDRVFTFLLLIVFLLIMRTLIKKLFPENYKFYFLLFFFFMLSVPVWCWSYANQVIEPLVCVFTAAGIYCFVSYLASRKMVFMILFAACVYLSFLSKGFQSCFVMVLPVAYFFISNRRRTLITFVLVALMLLSAAFLFTLKVYAPAMQWFQCYYQARLVLTMQNVGGTTDSHAEIIVRFFTELIIPLAIVVALLLYLAFKKRYPLKMAFKNFARNPLALSLLVTALAGSFPYALSLVQRGFYLVPSFVCLLLAILLGFKRYWLLPADAVGRLFSHKLVKAITVILFAGSLVYLVLACNGYKRDEELLTDLARIEPYLNEKDTVSIKGDLWNYFNLHSYLYMHKQINLMEDKQPRQFLILTKEQVNTDPSYARLNLDTKGLDLWVKNPAAY